MHCCFFFNPAPTAIRGLQNIIVANGPPSKDIHRELDTVKVVAVLGATLANPTGAAISGFADKGRTDAPAHYVSNKVAGYCIFREIDGSSIPRHIAAIWIEPAHSTICRLHNAKFVAQTRIDSDVSYLGIYWKVNGPKDATSCIVKLDPVRSSVRSFKDAI